MLSLFICYAFLRAGFSCVYWNYVFLLLDKEIALFRNAKFGILTGLYFEWPKLKSGVKLILAYITVETGFISPTACFYHETGSLI